MLSTNVTMLFRKTSHKDYILLLSEHKDFVSLSDSCFSLLQMNLLLGETPQHTAKFGMKVDFIIHRIILKISFCITLLIILLSFLNISNSFYVCKVLLVRIMLAEFSRTSSPVLVDPQAMASFGTRARTSNILNVTSMRLKSSPRLCLHI